MSTFLSIGIYAVGVLFALCAVAGIYIAVAHWLIKNTHDSSSAH